MACSKAHGPQAFVRYVKDRTGETITQQDWHDVRQMAGGQGADMGRGQVSAQEAIANLQALSARIKADEDAARKAKSQPRSVDEQVADLLAEREGGWEKLRSDFQANMAAQSASMARPAPASASAPQPVYTSAPADSREAEAEDELMGAKVTRGTLSVIRFFSTYGVKPVLAYVRARREETKRMKKAVKTVKRYKRMAAGY